MPVKVVMQNELSMGATERIREMAEVVVDLRDWVRKQQ